MCQFGDEPGATFFDGRMILELKYHGHLPAIFKRLVESFALETQTASKYRLGMEALGQVERQARTAVVSPASYA